MFGDFQPFLMYKFGILESSNLKQPSKNWLFRVPGSSKKHPTHLHQSQSRSVILHPKNLSYPWYPWASYSYLRDLRFIDCSAKSKFFVGCKTKIILQNKHFTSLIFVLVNIPFVPWMFTGYEASATRNFRFYTCTCVTI